MELRQYHRTRVLLDYNHFAANLATPVIICTNLAVVGIMRVLVESYGRRRINWVTSHTLGGYFDVDDNQYDIIDAVISEFLRETNDMAFCNNILTELRNIASAIAAQSCGCGTGGAGATDPPPSPEDPGTPGNPGSGTGLPDGFEDFAEYNAYKCDVAEWIIQQVENDLGWWSIADFTTITLTAFAAALLTPIPGDEIIGFLGFLVALSLQGVMAGAITHMQNVITDNRDGLICALYVAHDAAESKSQIDQAISDGVDAETSEIYGPLLTDILQTMFNVTNINRLYEKWVEKIPSLPTGDCSECGCIYTLTHGTEAGINDFDTEHFTGATDPPGLEVIQLDFFTGATRCEVNQVTITPTNINPSANVPGSFQGYRYYDASLTELYNSQTPPSSPQDGVSRIVIQSTTTGSAVINWE